MVRFGVVGIANTAVDYVVFNVLAFVLGTPVALANVISYSAGIANSWYWNRRWTFRDRPAGAARIAVPAFIAINLVGLALNTSIVLGVLSIVRTTGLAGDAPAAITANAAKVLAVGASYAWNYLALSRVVFRGGPRSTGTGSPSPADADADADADA